MASDLHHVTLTGRCAREPELRHTAGGTAILSIRLAYSSRAKDGDKWIEKSNYIDVAVWGNRGEGLSPYLSKGSRIAVQGRLEWREWEAQDGTKRQSYEVVADEIVLLDSKGSGSGSGSGSGWGSGGDAGESGASRYSGGEPAPGSSDDDIPF